MYHFKYVTKKELAPRREHLKKLIHAVQDDVRDRFTFRYDFIGSSARNMVTCDFKSNTWFDFDVNIEINDDEENYSPKGIKHILMNSFDKEIKKMNNVYILPLVNIGYVRRDINQKYAYCEDSTRVFTIKVKNNYNSKILYSCDFAVINNYGNGKQQYIRFNKKDNIYTWEEQPNGFYLLPEKIEFCKDNELWQDVRNTYLYKKNFNDDKNKKSRSLFAETIQEVCQKNGYIKKGGF